MGLITKHGILIVEFANQLREQGLEMVDALVKAASQRLRPILMTTGAMVLGAVPLAMASGAGAESRQQIGWVIVGGMSLGTLLTVFVVPTMYTLFARKEVPGANKATAREHPHGHGDLNRIEIEHDLERTSPRHRHDLGNGGERRRRHFDAIPPRRQRSGKAPARVGRRLETRFLALFVEYPYVDGLQDRARDIPDGSSQAVV